MYIITTNNTPQAYPAMHRGDAQTGGVLFLGTRHAIWQSVASLHPQVILFQPAILPMLFVPCWHSPWFRWRARRLSFRALIKPVAQQTGQKAAYSKNKAFDKQYYLDLICKAIAEHDSMNRKEIDELLWSKLPDWMTNEQKGNKVSNLLTELRLDRKIEKTGNTKTSKWVSLKSDQVRRF